MLVDTGSAVCFLPESFKGMVPVIARTTAFRGVDGSEFVAKASGNHKFTIKDRHFSFNFFYANLGKPILGTDFLSEHRVTVDYGARQLK